MTPIPVPVSLIQFIKDGSKFIIIGHKEPDGDSVGSQLALCSVLSRMGKRAIPFSAGPFKRPEVLPYAERFKTEPSQEDRSDARVIIMDCSTLERIGTVAQYIQGLALAVIDHHAEGKPSGDIVFLDPAAPSVTFMTLALIEALDMVPSPEEAELLFFGLATDTGFFRHVDSSGPETFEYASRMVSGGANPRKIFNAIHGGKSLDSRILMGLILSRTKAYFNGQVLLSYETLKDTERFGLRGRDSDKLYELLQSVEGVEAIALIRQESTEYCTIGLRSREAVDVSRIAANLGGGGHKQASGAYVQGTIALLKNRLLEEFSKVL